MSRIAPRTVYGIDGVGVRRRVPAGAVIPPGLRLTEPLPPVDDELAESKRVRAEKSGRGRAKGATKADRRGIKGDKRKTK